MPMSVPRVYGPVAGAIVTIFLTCAGSAAGQVVNPADKQAPPPALPAPATDRPRTWQMPPIDVYGEAPLHEEDRIGDYGQPRWTAHRRFSETRVYVIPKGMVDFEYWVVPETDRDGSTEFANQYEVEFGLPGRLQLDLYAVSHKSGGVSGPMTFDQQKVELRWALADWGRIPGNPTLYFEWKAKNAAPDHAEIKLLLGGHIASGWHWGSNFVWDHELAGARENSNEWTVGISRTIRDSKASAGIETQFALVNEVDASGHRPGFEKQFLIGPSFQFRPLPQMHIDVAPLFGATHGSPRSKVFVVVGYEF